MSSANSDSFTSFPIWILFFYVSCLIAVPWALGFYARENCIIWIWKRALWLWCRERITEEYQSVQVCSCVGMIPVRDKMVGWMRRMVGRVEKCYRCISVQFSHSVVFNSLWPHGLQHARPPCPSPTPGGFFSPASGSFQMSQLFTWGGQSIGVSASTSVLPMNTQDWSPLGWTGWISLQSMGLSRIFSNTTVQKHQFFGAQLSL